MGELDREIGHDGDKDASIWQDELHPSIIGYSTGIYAEDAEDMCMVAKIVDVVRPKYLYRYRNISTPLLVEQEADAIWKGHIWASPYNRMNDPMEGIYRQQQVAGVSAKEAESVASWIREEKDYWAFASFCESHENELMWAHYADQFRGICVRYDFEAMLKGLPNRVKFTRLSYAEHLPELALQEKNGTVEVVLSILSTKNYRWTYEREWRMFGTIGMNKYRGRCVDAVYLGERIEPGQAKAIRRSMRKLKPPVPVYRMAVDGYHLAFKRERV